MLPRPMVPLPGRHLTVGGNGAIPRGNDAKSVAVNRRGTSRGERGSLVVSHAVDAGRIRSVNEDRVFVDEALGLFVVADGMGGMRNGGEAADIVLEVVANLLTARSADESVIVAAIVSADEAVRTALGEGSSGSTVVVGQTTERHVVIAHAGDSRATMLRNGRLIALTADHNLAAVYVESGQLSADEARSHPSSSRLTSYVGMGVSMTVEVDRVEIEPGDWVILATDGLSLMLSDNEIVAVLSGSEPGTAAQALVDATLEAGAFDNVGVIVMSASE